MDCVLQDRRIQVSRHCVYFADGGRGMGDKKGKLIIIEAGDASGKETQTRLLYEKMNAEGKNVKRVEFPDYEAESSVLVRMYLSGKFGKQAEDVDAYAASTFFAVDRYASYRMKWKKDYEAGTIILSDRYTTSNLIHQAIKLKDETEREKYTEWLQDLEYEKLGLPRPDCVVFLDMAPAVSDKLLAARAEETGVSGDIHEKDKAYLHRCYEAYCTAAEKFGWKHVVCSDGVNPRPPKEIAEDVWNAVRDYI